LKKILQYHIVPDFILHSGVYRFSSPGGIADLNRSDWVHDASSGDDLMPPEEDTSEDWYANSKFTPFPRSRTKEVKEMMRKWKETTSVINLPKGGLMAEIKGEEAPKRCLQNRRMRAYTEPNTSWPPHREHPNLTVNITIPTLLEDHSVRFVVAKPKMTWPHWIRSLVFVNGQGTGPEAVARNGVVYMLPRLLHPCKPNHGDGGDDKGQDGRWEDWEEWLPAWGEL
jgi:hypothetical protein